MGILDKIYHAIFGGEDKQENSEFDLKALKENLRKVKEKESEKKKPIPQKSNEKKQRTDGGNSEIIREIIWRDDWTKNCRTIENTGKKEFDGKSSSEMRELSNPLLLGAKMFLADVIYMVNIPYDSSRHNCSNFAKDVQNAASKQGIRCGYVRINFKDSEIGHAIVAFETDYGLKFFEPQSAEEENVIVGRYYSAHLSENLDYKIISKV
jgi:hypothetical protein